MRRRAPYSQPVESPVRPLCKWTRRIGATAFALLALSAGVFPVEARSVTFEVQAPKETASQANSAQSAAPSTTNTEQIKTEQFTLSHERQEKAIAYSRAGYALYFLSYFLGLATLLVILRSGLAAKFRDLAEHFSDRRLVQALVFVPLLLVTVAVVELPVRLYWHSLSLHYQQSVQGWGSWAGDWMKGELLDVTFGIVLALILFAVMRRSPRHWWFYFWFPGVAILVGLIVLTPMVIDPMFNKFEPLSQQHPELVESIEKLAQRAGVSLPPDRIFLMEASKKTNNINAYVTGLGASKRVVVWDTTIQKMSNDETLFVVGHELGHYVLGHVVIGVVMGSAGLLLALYLLFRGLHWAMDRWAKDWKLYGQEDWAALAGLLLLLQLMLFLASPVISGLSRVEEHAADVYGLEVIHGVIPNSEEVAAHAFQVMGELDLADPNPPPLITFWLYSHPPLAERLVFAHSYDPWSKGEAPKYVK